MSQKISPSTKKAVILRANSRCEYCHIPDTDSYYGFEVDHIISRKHGGENHLDNLAYACPDCNRYKGSDLGTYLDNMFDFVRFFHPRLDDWSVHFELQDSGLIVGKTTIGNATIRILAINHPDRIIERKLLWKLGLINPK